MAILHRRAVLTGSIGVSLSVPRVNAQSEQHRWFRIIGENNIKAE